MGILMGPWSLATTLLLAGPANVEIRREVVYGTGGGHDLTLDLYLPRSKAEGLRPAMVWYHGGGFVGGNPFQFEPQCLALAAEGFVCVSARYRLNEEGRFPAAVEDAKCAVRWLRANAADLHVDPDRIGAGGGSAGGYLSAMVAFAEGYEGEGGPAEVSSKVACYAGYNPVLDCPGMRHDHPAMVGFLGLPFEDDPDLWRASSPLEHVAAGAPPSLVLHGDADTTVPIAGAYALMEKLAALGVEHELFVAEGQQHAFFNGEPWLSRTMAAMVPFVKRVLG